LQGSQREAGFRQFGDFAGLYGGLGGDGIRLLAAVNDPGRDIPWRAVDALGEIRDQRAVPTLIATLDNHHPVASGQLLVVPGMSAADKAGEALGKIGPPAVDPLIAALGDSEAEVRKRAASALTNINDRRAAGVLQRAFRQRDMIVIAGAHLFFMKKGDPTSLNVLIEALNLRGVGDVKMVDDFLNSGNARLEKAGEDWAKSHQYLLGVNGNGRRGVFIP